MQITPRSDIVWGFMNSLRTPEVANWLERFSAFCQRNAAKRQLLNHEMLCLIRCVSFPGPPVPGLKVCRQLCPNAPAYPVYNRRSNAPHLEQSKGLNHKGALYRLCCLGCFLADRDQLSALLLVILFLTDLRD
jgi:hypothetical protein